MNGIEVIPELRRLSPSSKIIIIPVHDVDYGLTKREWKILSHYVDGLRKNS
jgi:DNA-binding NarL/FixJ family response regulator